MANSSPHADTPHKTHSLDPSLFLKVNVVLVWGSPMCDCKDMLVTLGNDQP